MFRQIARFPWGIVAALAYDSQRIGIRHHWWCDVCVNDEIDCVQVNRFVREHERFQSAAKMTGSFCLNWQVALRERLALLYSPLDVTAPLQPGRDQPARDRPGAAKAPTREHVCRPMHSQIDAAGADQNGQRDGHTE